VIDRRVLDVVGEPCARWLDFRSRFPAWPAPRTPCSSGSAKPRSRLVRRAARRAQHAAAGCKRTTHQEQIHHRAQEHRQFALSVSASLDAGTGTNPGRQRLDGATLYYDVRADGQIKSAASILRGRASRDARGRGTGTVQNGALSFTITPGTTVQLLPHHEQLRQQDVSRPTCCKASHSAASRHRPRSRRPIAPTGRISPRQSFVEIPDKTLEKQSMRRCTCFASASRTGEAAPACGQLGLKSRVER